MADQQQSKQGGISEDLKAVLQLVKPNNDAALGELTSGVNVEEWTEPVGVRETVIDALPEGCDPVQNGGRWRYFWVRNIPDGKTPEEAIPSDLLTFLRNNGNFVTPANHGPNGSHKRGAGIPARLFRGNYYRISDKVLAYCNPKAWKAAFRKRAEANIRQYAESLNEKDVKVVSDGKVEAELKRLK